MRRSGIVIMGRLIGLIRPLMLTMLCAILSGVAGYLCAIFLTVMAAAGILTAFSGGAPVSAAGLLAAAGVGTSPASVWPVFLPRTLGGIFAALCVMAVLRGILHYLEQECNHYIAFKLLAIIRHKVFAALRGLCPAKLEGRDRGNLISMITSDIELLEVFYAHTISPIAIAVIVSLLMLVFFAGIHPLCAVLALCAYLCVGAVLPLWNAGRGAAAGMAYREAFGAMNSFILDSLRGLRETVQYGAETAREHALSEGSERLLKKQERLSGLEGDQRAVTGLCITLFSFGMLFLCLHLYAAGAVPFTGAVLVPVAMMGSFGPVTALSSLSNNLNQTLACGERVLSLLEETPQVEELSGQPSVTFAGAACEHVDFAYGKEQILSDMDFVIPTDRILGIHGRSGCGKSTLLRLLMRFWDVSGGKVTVSGRDIRGINTTDLRRMEGFVTQETVLFHDSIANNIAIGKPGASREEIMEAAKKASIHEFIMTLPDGYDTAVGELGGSLSGGERQRIGIARAFLHDAPFLLLDEPTSNLDSLNEGIILKSLHEEKTSRTVVLVSHRRSTLNIADEILEMEAVKGVPVYDEKPIQEAEEGGRSA
ncbi:MAG: ABC transporter ATP-binding protein [Eubacteriales bacterium]|nr:ABC transporter ATP-binding protein [Eubacteriales bacterium]